MQINQCPRCGREPCEWINEKDFHAIGYEFSCGSCGFCTGSCKTYDEAVAKWNELTNKTKGENK
jgi:hypothetical protein